MPTPDDHDPPRRGLFSARGSAISIVVASLATLGVVVVMVNSADDTLHVQTIPAQPNSTSPSAATPATSLPPPTAAPRAPAAPLPPAAPRVPAAASAPPPVPAFAIDAQGFVDSARCSDDQRAVAIARTERSTMVVCEAADGTLEYEGVRLGDGATLRLDDVRPISAGFEARNGGTTYRLSPTELVVITGESLYSRDAIVEYRAG
ncbi:hypothetical protein FHR72_004682 [Mycolicibacterium iranicum]|uniref:Serine/threonine protein kinase n=1 Tax=Mycolicibacterium iranicum TaxID=912594 RepID=A0A839QF94_MYCIR|nr:hypothetical protein [Mycolicibacterium iranicum]MBB2993175.1 hypothetical protein [Mycolicibacterium iranicum]